MMWITITDVYEYREVIYQGGSEDEAQLEIKRRIADSEGECSLYIRVENYDGSYNKKCEALEDRLERCFEESYDDYFE